MSWVYLKLSRELWCVLKSPKRSDQRREPFRNFSSLVLTVLIHDKSVHSPVTQIQFISLQTQIFCEHVRVAQALHDGVHEAGVPVVLQTQRAWRFVPVQREQSLFRGGTAGKRGTFPHLAAAVLFFHMSRVSSARCAFSKPTIIILSIGPFGCFPTASQASQTFQDLTHQTFHRFKRFPPEQFPCAFSRLPRIFFRVLVAFIHASCLFPSVLLKRSST